MKHQQQIQNFEDRFKFYEEERLKFERFKLQNKDEERKTTCIQRENEELQAIIQEQKAQIEGDSLKMYQMGQTIDQKERLYTHIKEQVEEMSK